MEIINHFLKDYIIKKSNIEKIFIADKNVLIEKKDFIENLVEGFSENKNIDDQISSINNFKSVDLIVSFPSLVNKIYRKSSVESITSKFYFDYALHLMKLLDKKSELWVVLPSLCLFNKKFVDEVLRLNLKMVSVIELPSNILKNSVISLTLLILRKEYKNKSFFSSILKESNWNNYLIDVIGAEIEKSKYGIFADKVFGFSYKNATSQNEIDFILKNYDYPMVKFRDLCIEIKDYREKSEINNDIIYFPRHGKKIYIDSKKIKGNGNYYKITLDTEKVLKEYIKYFFESKVGIKMISNISNVGSIISHIRKNSLENIYIPMPEIEEQSQILATHTNIKSISNKLEEFSKELFTSPKNAFDINHKLRELDSILNNFDHSEKIISLIKNGENKWIEFKSCCNFDYFTKEKSKESFSKVRRAIASFLNSLGGTLLIGVKDDGEICGIDNEIIKSDDEYLLNFKDKIKETNTLKEGILHFINFDIVIVNDFKILVVDCQPSSKPIFITKNKKENFYFRVNRSTEEIKDKYKQLDYIAKRFYKKK